jgi:Domain of unknown function (DUF4157)
MQQFSSTTQSEHGLLHQGKPTVSHTHEAQSALDYDRPMSAGAWPRTSLHAHPLGSMGGGMIQTKLEIGAPDDPLEHEADAMADRVMRMPLSGATHEGASGNGAYIQRKCAACEQEEKIQPKAQSASAGPGHASAQLTGQIQATRGSGHRLDGQTRGYMETGFNRDFSGVKIHTGDYAHEMNQQLGARAFTVGNDVYFRRGEYQPGAESGRRLLAHELAHTVQQGAVPMVQRKADEDGKEQNFPKLDASHAELAAFGSRMVRAVGYETIINKGIEHGLLQHGPSATTSSQTKIQRQTFAEAFAPFAYAAGISALADTPGPGPGDLVALGILAVGLVAAAVIVTTATRVCPPCPAPPPIDIDRVPPSTPHFPCLGDHWHYYQYNQNPVTCACYGPRRMFGGCCGFPGAPC